MALWVSLPSLLTFEYFSTCLLTASEKKDCDNKFRHYQTPCVLKNKSAGSFSGKKISLYIYRLFFFCQRICLPAAEDTRSLMVSEFIVTILLFSCCQKTSGKILKCKQRRETYPKCHYYKHCVTCSKQKLVFMQTQKKLNSFLQFILLHYNCTHFHHN